MRSWVLDTSAVMRLFIPDGPIPQGMEEAIESALRHEAVLLAPQLLLAEAGQVVRKKERAGYLSAAQGDEVLAAIKDLPVEYQPHGPLLGHAVEISRRSNLTVYDALFVALARERNSDIITADDQVMKNGLSQSPEDGIHHLD